MADIAHYDFSALEAAFAEQAREIAERAVQARADAYTNAPDTLDTIERGMAAMDPARLCCRLGEMIAEETGRPRRYMGFGGETVLINLKGALRHAVRAANKRDAA